MRAELLDGIDGAASVEEDWRRLAVAQGNAFLTPDWYRAWLSGAGEGQQPMIAVVRRDGGEVAGVMPFAFDGSARPRALRFGGSGFGDRFGVASEPGEEAAVAAAAMPALEESLPGSAMIVLHKIEVGSEWPEAMRSASSRRLAVIEQSTAEQPHVVVSGLDWEGYLAGRSRKFRQRIARGLEKSLDQAGIAYSVRETRSADDLDADMQTLFRLHDARREPGASSISAPRVRGFLTGFAADALAQGWLRLRILELDGQPAAAYLGWVVGSRYAVYQSGFDPAWAEQSAGTVLLNDTVRSAIGEQVDEVDFLMGGEPYKWRFAPQPRVVRTIVLVGATSPARALVAGEAFAREHGKRFASRPRAARLMKAIARMLPSGRSA